MANTCAGDGGKEAGEEAEENDPLDDESDGGEPMRVSHVHFESQHQKYGTYCLLVSVILHQSLHFAGI